VAEIVWCINIFHLTWPTSPPYLVKLRCSTLLHNVEMYYCKNHLTTELAHSKLKYGLFSRVISVITDRLKIEACPLRKADLNVLDFLVNRLFMKLFRTNNIGMVKECQSYFSFQLPTEMLKQRTERFDMKFKRLSASWL